MTVTRVEELSKSKVTVTFENDLTLTLYKGELRTYRIREQEELSQEAYEALLAALGKRAKLRCMNLLKSRDYTEYQLRVKLKDGGYPQIIADQAVEYVSSYGYVDDDRYARSYIESRSLTKSNRQIENDLLRKGVDRQCIARAFEETRQEWETDTEYELIRRQLEKKHYDAAAPYEIRQKVIASLYRKGFQLDKIYKIIDEIQET